MLVAICMMILEDDSKMKMSPKNDDIHKNEPLPFFQFRCMKNIETCESIKNIGKNNPKK